MMMKMMTEAIQRVRGEIATPSARNDRGGGGIRRDLKSLSISLYKREKS